MRGLEAVVRHRIAAERGTWCGRGGAQVVLATAVWGRSGRAAPASSVCGWIRNAAYVRDMRQYSTYMPQHSLRSSMYALSILRLFSPHRHRFPPPPPAPPGVISTRCTIAVSMSGMGNGTAGL